MRREYILQVRTLCNFTNMGVPNICLRQNGDFRSLYPSIPVTSGIF